MRFKKGDKVILKFGLKLCEGEITGTIKRGGGIHYDRYSVILFDGRFVKKTVSSEDRITLNIKAIRDDKINQILIPHIV